MITMVIYPCVYGPQNSPRILESGKFLLVEFGIPLMIGIWNPSSTDKGSRIWNFLGQQNFYVSSNARKNHSVQIKVDTSITILVSASQHQNSRTFGEAWTYVTTLKIIDA